MTTKFWPSRKPPKPSKQQPVNYLGFGDVLGIRIESTAMQLRLARIMDKNAADGGVYRLGDPVPMSKIDTVALKVTRAPGFGFEEPVEDSAARDIVAAILGIKFPAVLRFFTSQQALTSSPP